MHLINQLYTTSQQCVARLLQEGNHPVFILRRLYKKSRFHLSTRKSFVFPLAAFSKQYSINKRDCKGNLFFNSAPMATAPGT